MKPIRLTGKAAGRIFRSGSCWLVGLPNQLLVQRLEIDLDQQAGERLPGKGLKMYSRIHFSAGVDKDQITVEGGWLEDDHLL